MPFTGSVRLLIIEGHDLKPNQFSVRHKLNALVAKNVSKDGQQILIDPYVNIVVDDILIDRSSTKESTFKPLWNECFSSDVKDAQNLLLTVFDETAIPSSEFVANCSIAFDDLMKDAIPEGTHNSDFWIDLEPSGRLHVSIELRNDTQSMSSQKEPKLFKERQGLSQRRGAIRRRVHQINGHKFMATIVEEPTLCSHCPELIWGLGKPGYKCEDCTCVVHKRCHEFVITKCCDYKESSDHKFNRFSIKVLQRFFVQNYKRFH